MLHPHIPATDLRADTGRRRSLGWIGAAAMSVLGGGLLGTPAPAAATPLDKVRQRGSLVVGVYNDMAPFHDAGRGIDVDIARQLAEALGVKLSLLPFNADENMNDDLRNMVWRGHYLGYGPADVLMHVPVDPPLMQANPRVQIFAPYYRDRVVIARDLSRTPQMESLAVFRGQPIAAAGNSLAGWLMIGAENGAYRDQVRTKIKDGLEAARLLRTGDVAAAVGQASELESVLRGDARFAIDPLPLPRAPRDGWAVGLAVKKDSTDLAQALQAAMNELSSSGRLRTAFEVGNVNWRAA
jgi:ABC-type amino acid transport substrate-binding protein